MKLVRGAICSSLLLLGGIFAHYLSGGAFISDDSILGFFTLSALLSLLLVYENVSELRLFTAVFVAQNGSHFLLGGEVHQPISMLMSHSLAGAATYVSINRASDIFNGLCNLIDGLRSSFLPNILFPRLAHESTSGWTFVPYLFAFAKLDPRSNISLRAPPRN